MDVHAKIGLGPRSAESHRLIGRGMQSVRDFVLRTHDYAIVDVAKALALRLGMTDRLIEAIAYSGYPAKAVSLRKDRHCYRCPARSLRVWRYGLSRKILAPRSSPRDGQR